MVNCLIKTSLQIYNWVRQWTNLKNRSTFGEDTDKSLVFLVFSTHSVFAGKFAEWWSTFSPHCRHHCQMRAIARMLHGLSVCCMWKNKLVTDVVSCFFIYEATNFCDTPRMHCRYVATAPQCHESPISQRARRPMLNSYPAFQGQIVPSILNLSSRQISAEMYGNLRTT